MNFWYTGFLILWCILIIGNCYQGQNLIIPNTDNTDSNIYIYFQILSTTTSVMLAIIIACNICVNYCNQDKWESDDFLAFVMFPLTLVQITMFGLIGTNIESVSGYSDTKDFKIVLSVCGGVSAIPVFYSLYKIIKYLFPTPEEMAEREKRKEKSKNDQLTLHKIQEEQDLRKADRQHKLQLDYENRQLQRENELIIQNAKEEVFTKNQLLAKEKAENAAKRAREEQILEAERITEMLAEDKRARESSVNIDRMTRQEKLRTKELERNRRQKDFDEETEMRKLKEDKENKELEESRERRKLRQDKDLQESLYKKNLERQRHQRIDEEELSVKEIKRLKDSAEYHRDQLKRKLTLALLGKSSSDQIKEIEGEISQLTKKINDLSPAGKDKDSTIAQVPPDENDDDCQEMSDVMKDMEKCGQAAQGHRDYFNGIRDRLSKHCPDKYRQMDEYEEKCRKDKPCNDLRKNLDNLEKCDEPTKFLRARYKTEDYAHCIDQNTILDKYIVNCDSEEKKGHSTVVKYEQKNEAPPPRPTTAKPKIQGTIAQLPKIPDTIAQLPQRTSSGELYISTMEDQNPDDHKAFDIDVQQKKLVPIPPLSPGPQSEAKYNYLNSTVERFRKRGYEKDPGLDNEDMYEDDETKLAINTCKYITDFTPTFKDCVRGKNLRKTYLQMDPKILEQVALKCPINHGIIQQAEEHCKKTVV